MRRKVTSKTHETIAELQMWKTLQADLKFPFLFYA